MKMTRNDFRKIISAIILNKKKQVMMCEHIWIDDAWQFPQGGIEEGEKPEATIFRELDEELATNKFKILGKMDEKIKYYFPYYLKEKYNCPGNEQVFFLLYYYGDESEIRFDNQLKPEFQSYKWVNYEEPAKKVVYFKKLSYHKALNYFRKFVDNLNTEDIEKSLKKVPNKR